MDKDKVIELLECVKINIDNISKVGLPMAGLVKIQIDEAIDLIKGEEE